MRVGTGVMPWRSWRGDRPSSTTCCPWSSHRRRVGGRPPALPPAHRTTIPIVLGGDSDGPMITRRRPPSRRGWRAPVLCEVLLAVSTSANNAGVTVRVSDGVRYYIYCISIRDPDETGTRPAKDSSHMRWPVCARVHGRRHSRGYARGEPRRQRGTLLLRPGGDEPHQAATRAAGYG